jgi:hypothetical protein
MDTTNFKNKLQEYFQKRALELPIYDYEKVISGWRARLILANTSKNYIGDVYPSKIKSAQSVAKKAYLELNNLNNIEDESRENEKDIVQHKPIDVVVINDSLNPIYILVDFENVPHTDKLENLLKNNSSSSITLLKFASINHSNLHLVDYVIPTTTKDATDHYIGVYLGMLIATIKEKLTVFVITKDHFGEVFEIIYNKLGNPNINIKHFTNQDFTLEYITQNYNF